jgi:dTDP-4-amino-4,6-dideoxygalactose transaminase
MAVEGFLGAAAEVGVEIRRYYRPSLSRWPETATCGACPVAEDLADRMCVLPVRAQMPGADSDALAEIVVRALDSVLALSH